MRFLLIAVVIVLLALLALSPLADNDTWTHLAAGKYISTHRSIPAHDPFSWTLDGKPWVDHEWLFQVPAWQLYAFQGPSALVLAKVVLVLAIFLLLLVTVHRSDVPLLGASLVGLAALACYPRFVVRPELFSLLFLVLFLFLLERFRRTRRPGLLWLLLPLECLWANVHAYFIVGNLVLTVYLLGELLLRVPTLSRFFTAERLRPDRLRLLAWVWLLSFVATVVNPNLLAGALYPYRSLAQLSAGSMNYITELASPLGASFTLWCHAFLLLSVLAVVSLLLRGRKLLPAHLILLLLALAASFSAVRNVPYLAVVAVVVSARHAGDLIAGFRARYALDARWWSRWALKPLLVLAVVAFFSWQSWRVATERIYLDDYSTQTFGLGVDSARFSLDSLDFLARHNLHGDLANDFAVGGFLAFGRFPESRVAVDGRAELYASSDPSVPDLLSFNNALLSGAVPLQNPRTREPLDIVYFGLNSPVGNLIAGFLADPRFKLVFADQAAVVFVRADASPSLPAVDLSALADSTVHGLESSSPGRFLPRLNIPWGVVNVAGLLQLSGRYDLSERVMRACVDRYPYAATPRRQLALVLAAQSRNQDALDVALQAHAIDPDLTGLPILLARLYLLTGDRPRALDFLARARAQVRFRPADLEPVADLYYDASLPRQAADCLAPVWASTPSLSIGLKYSQALLDAGDIGRASLVAASLASTHPRDPRVRKLLSLIDRARTR